MSTRHQPDLEESLRAALRSLAPQPRPALLERTLAAISDSPQRSRRAPQRSRRAQPRPAWRSAWTWAAGTVVIVAGIGAGLLFSDTVPPAADGPGASGGPTSSGTSSASTPTPSLVAAPSSVAPRTWERFDLPDLAPGAFTSTRVSDVLTFNGEYVAVGTFSAYCSSDIHETPPGCEAVVDALPTTMSAAVWVSEDARTWEQLPHQDSFEGGGMQHAATDGERVVVTGVLYEPSARPLVAWVSDDGRNWELIGQEELVPEQVVVTTEGLIGARPTDDGPQFVASEDGRSWQALTEPGELGPGQVFGLAVGRDGLTVTAVGSTYQYPEDGEIVITATSWLSRDGVTWERAPANDGHDGAEMIAVTDTDAGWVAVGVASEMAVWTSPDGRIWSREDGVAAPYGGPDDIVWTGNQVIATGTVGGESSSVLAFWLSPDGRSWERVVPDESRGAGAPARIVIIDGLVVVGGVRSTGPDHSIGVIWIGGP